MMTAELDLALRPEFADGMPERCSDLELHLIENVGHWAQQEAPDVVNAPLLTWLTRQPQVLTEPHRGRVAPSGD